jgi:tripartite-type tricarboxylate transporter receptor subunit TctC
MALFGAEYLGWNIKFVLGYPGSNELYLSFERGELDMFASGTAEIVNRFVKSGVAVPLAAANRRSDFPDVPSFEELLGNKKPSGVEWQAFYACASADLVDKYFAAPPKVPSAIVKTLRDSFMATLKDEAFLAQAQKVLADGVIPVSVEELREHIKEAIDIPPEVATQVLALRKKYNLPIGADAQPK